jgi:hypothetical protein
VVAEVAVSRESKREALNRRRAAAARAGRCARCCTQTPAKGRRICPRCVTKGHARREARRAAGLLSTRRVRFVPPLRAPNRPHIPGQTHYHCFGYRRDGHYTAQIWSTERLCLTCMARREADLGVVYVTLTPDEDRADEMLALSYGAIAARGR